MENWRVRSPAVAPRPQGSWRDRNTPEEPVRVQRDFHNDREANWRQNRGHEYNTIPQKLSQKELLLISNMKPFDVFLEILDNEKRFLNVTLEEGKSYEMIVILIIIIGKLHQSPLKSHLEDLVRQIFGQSIIFRNDIIGYIKYAVDLEENNEDNKISYADKVWSSLEIFCSYAKKIKGTVNCWAYFIRAICGILDGKKQRSLTEKHSQFLKLQHEIENNYFYQETIYASLMDVTNERKYEIPKQVNGKFDDIKEYLDFQILYLRRYFLPTFYEGIKAINLKENIRNKLLVKVGKAFIFPTVQIYQPSKNQKKYFLLDFLPQLRRNSKSEQFFSMFAGIFNYSPLLFLSTTQNFTDLIVLHAPNPVNVEFLSAFKGLLYVDIVRMENIKENIFKKDLFLLRTSNGFEPQLHTLHYLENMSTASLPMKEYLVNCEVSAALSSYENINLKSEMENLEMNEKQIEAFEAGLTKKITQIQGPAGTGKSTVTMNIIKSLLKNTSQQIVGVAYSIPTLDEFLLKCSEFTDKIVRVGYTSIDKKVKEMHLTMVVADPRWHRLRKHTYSQLICAMEKFSDTMKGSFDSPEEIEKELRNLRLAKLKNWEMTPLRNYYESKNARIIGITTTGTAKYHQLLELLQPSVVIIEEASIAPESHLITSLTEYTKQIILVGDLKQKTHITELGFSMLFAPNTQLFDRMMKNDINSIRLNVQYRMHPDIADLIRTQTFYEDLVDGENVKKYEPIRGIGKNVFCVSQTNIEGLSNETCEFWSNKISTMDNDDSSEDDNDEDEDEDESVNKDIKKENSYLMLYCIGLANFLRYQGYKSDEVMILTNEYDRGKIRNLFGRTKEQFPLLEGINVHSKYEFRGRECKIVILCLMKGSHVTSRLCSGPHCVPTLLARAKEGLFIVENVFSILEEEPYWKKVKTILEDKGAIGAGLPIKCEKHGSEIIAKTMKDFVDFTENGCSIGKDLPKTNNHPCLEIAQTKKLNENGESNN